MATVFNRLHKGAWSLNKRDSSDIVKDDASFSCYDSIMIWLPVPRSMRANATTFASAVDASRPEHVFSMGFVHMMLKLSMDVRDQYFDSREHSSADHPIEVFVEVVVGNDKSTDPRDKGTYGNTHEQCKERSFMKGIEDERPVVEYRVWFIVTREIKDAYGRNFFDTIDHLKEKYEMEYGGRAGGGSSSSAPSVKRRKANDSDGPTIKDNSAAVSAAAAAANSPMEYGRSIQETELWRHFRSLELVAQTFDFMYGIKSFQLKKNMTRAYENQKDCGKNPLHPRYALSPERYFRHPDANAHPKQSAYENYFSNNGRTLRFPMSSCVVRLPYDDYAIGLFMQRMLPDYQARCIGDQLEFNVILAEPRLTMAQLAREIEEIGSVRRGAGNFDDEAAEIFGNCIMDLDDSDDVVDPLFSSSSSSVGSTAAGVEPGGGSTMSEKLEMLKSLDMRNDNGEIELADARVLNRQNYESDETFRGEEMLMGYDGPERSHFHYLRFLGEQDCEKLAATAVTKVPYDDDVRQDYVLLQRRMLRMYADECTSHLSDISVAGRKINGWYLLEARSGRRWVGDDHHLLDPSLSFWANSVVRRAMRFECALYVATAHDIGLLLSYASMNAFWHELDLHFNMFICGPPEASKSYMLDVIEQLFIPGTTYQLTSQSRRATNVEMDVNDVVALAHETRMNNMRANDTGDNEGEEQLKEELGKCLAIRNVNQMTPSGKFMLKRIVSQRMQVHVRVSNAEMNSVSKAVRSRHSCYPITIRSRKDKSAAEMADIEKIKTTMSIMRKNEFVQCMRHEQMLAYHANKAIAIRALTQPTLYCTMVIRQRFLNHMKTRHGLDVDPRTTKRILMLTCQFVINRAMLLLYSSPLSPYYKEAFDIKHLAYADRYLYDSEEMVCVAIDMLRHEMVSVLRRQVLELFRDEFLTQRTASRASMAALDNDASERTLYDAASKEFYMTAATMIVPPHHFAQQQQQSNHDDDAAASSNKEASSSSLEHNHKAGHGSDFPSARREVSVPAAHVYSEHHINGYVRVKGMRLSAIADAMSHRKTEDGNLLDIDTIMKQLKAFTRESISARKYEWSDATIRPEPTTTVDDTSGRQPVESAIWTKDAFFVHLDLLDSLDIDPVDDSLAQCLNSHKPVNRSYATDTTGYKLLSGMSMHGDRPYLLKTRRVDTTKAREPLVYKEYTEVVTETTLLAYPHMAANPKKFPINKAEHVLTTHIDEMARRQRLRDLFLNPDCEAAYKADDQQPTIEDHERYMRENIDENALPANLRYVLKSYVDYPDDLDGEIHFPTSFFRKKKKA